jgi:mutual gliding-motility protein MglA
MHINNDAREIVARIVYYGPGFGGKTTNLEQIYGMLAPGARTRLITLPNKEDRTLFFDLLALERGEIKGYTLRFQLYTVPGQVFYNATRKLVLKGVDGVVFVADSSPDRLDANLESMANLYDNLATAGIDPRTLGTVERLPLVIQYNKRDFPAALPTVEMERLLNPTAAPAFEAVAVRGKGVREVLREILDLTERSLRARS